MRNLSAILTVTAIALFLFPLVTNAQSVAERVKGKILLQVEENGEAWYINPSDKRRYYLGRPDDAFSIMRYLGVGTSNEDLAKIPEPHVFWDGDHTLMRYVRGKILLQVEENGEAWYVNPANGKRYFLARPDDAFDVMKNLGLGINNSNLYNIRPNIEIKVQPVSPMADHSTEYVEVRNLGSTHQDIGQWKLRDSNGALYTFPRGYTMRPGEWVRIHTNHGSHSFNSTSEIWEDPGDTAYLYSVTNALIDTDTYGSSNGGVVLPVPFTAQAPHANWSAPYNEACEESILVMLDHYFRRTGLNADQADAEIRRLVDWQNANFGYYEDTGVEQTGQMAEANYSWDYETLFHINGEDIKQALRDGHPVIVPVSGRDLGNPHFRAPGPLYHMVLVIGYDQNAFIVHEPGTRYGESYRYGQQSFVATIHDLTNPEANIRNGVPAILIVTP